MWSFLDSTTDALAPMLIARSADTQALFKAMKKLRDGSWGDRHTLMLDLQSAVRYADNPDALDLSVRYKGWNALHYAAYYGSPVMYHLCGGKDANIDLDLVMTRNRPQNDTVLMCLAYGKSSCLSQHEWDFEQAGFKMIYLMSDQQLQATDKNGCSALHYAAVHGVVKMVAALIERNIDIQARGIMKDREDEFMTAAIDIVATKEFVEGEGWVELGEDTTPRTALECAELNYKMNSKWKPDHANSQIDLKRVIELLKKATPQPEVPTAVPIITTMLTVAMMPAGQTMQVATPKGALSIAVPPGCAVGTFFQFQLPEPIPVADFRAWPRDIAVQTMTTATTTTVSSDLNGDGLIDKVMTTTTTTSSTTAETKDIDGDGKADGVLSIAA